MGLESFFLGYETQMTNLALYTAAIAVYVLIVWTFYHRLSKRDMVKVPFVKGRVSPTVFAIIKYLIVFPVVSFLWFLMLASLLFFLSKSQSVEQILLIAMTIIAATRVTAYAKEEMANDLSKLIPLALLAVYIADPAYFSLATSLLRFIQAIHLTPLIVRYFVFVIGLELTLRMMHGFVSLLRYKGLLPSKEGR